MPSSSTQKLTKIVEINERIEALSEMLRAAIDDETTADLLAEIKTLEKRLKTLENSVNSKNNNDRFPQPKKSEFLDYPLEQLKVFQSDFEGMLATNIQKHIEINQELEKLKPKNDKKSVARRKNLSKELQELEINTAKKEAKLSEINSAIQQKSFLEHSPKKPAQPVLVGPVMFPIESFGLDPDEKRAEPPPKAVSAENLFSPYAVDHDSLVHNKQPEVDTSLIPFEIPEISQPSNAPSDSPSLTSSIEFAMPEKYFPQSTTSSTVFDIPDPDEDDADHKSSAPEAPAIPLFKSLHEMTEEEKIMELSHLSGEMYRIQGQPDITEKDIEMLGSMLDRKEQLENNLQQSVQKSASKPPVKQPAELRPAGYNSDFFNNKKPKPVQSKPSSSAANKQSLTKADVPR